MGDVPDEELRPQEHPWHYTEGYSYHHAYHPSHYASSQTSPTTHFSPQGFPPGSIPPYPNFQQYPAVPHLAVHSPYFYPYAQGPHPSPQYSYSHGASPTTSTPSRDVYSDQRSAPGPGIMIPPHAPSPSPTLTHQHPYPHMIYSQPPTYQYSASGPVPRPMPVPGPYPYHSAVDQGAEPWYFVGPSHIAGAAEFNNRHSHVAAHQYSPQVGTIEHHSGGLSAGPSYASIVSGSAPDPSFSPRHTIHPSPPSRTLSATVPGNVGTTTRSRQRPPERHLDRSSTVGRRPYQPNPPPNRSEWVMWVGNVPADGSQEELTRFFTSVTLQSTSPSLDLDPSTEAETRSESGVQSIFLISQSNCAFVNYDSEAKLLHAVSVCNGHPLRPHDPRCLKLVCRIRSPEEDLRAGVGAQRGMGMHTKWVHEKRFQERGVEAGPGTAHPSTKAGVSSTSPTDDPIGEELAVPPQSSEPNQGPQSAKPSPIPLQGNDGSSGSISFASTTSSFLAAHFPQRFFILKSRTQRDLDLSVERRVWATQPHNEPILDQAYRTSTDVFLIFGANKSGEFFGYARMAGPINPSASLQVPWSSRMESSQRGKHDFIKESEISEMGPSVLDAEPSPASSSPKAYVPFGGSHRAIEAGNLVAPSQSVSAPTEVARFPYASTTGLTGDARDLPIAPILEFASLSMAPRTSSSPRHHGDTMVQAASGEASTSVQAIAQSPPQTSALWGTPFPVEWIRVKRLPFNRTKHLRNPWNTDREIKVSRDGTELEPGVGQRLLAEWDNSPTALLSPRKGSGSRGGSGRLSAAHPEDAI